MPTVTCRCEKSRFVRSLEEDDFNFPQIVTPLGATQKSTLGRCRACGIWWERIPHEVYGYAWFYTEQAYWDAADELRMLVTHGVLHICGWDHATPAEEAAMRAVERRLLGVDLRP